MRIDVITLHAVQNYGSVLQAYATQKLLEEHGADVRIIDFARDVVKYENLAEVWSKGSRWKKLVMLPTIRRWKTVFRGFCEENLNLTTQSYTTEADFQNDPPDADAFCTGSDQVWNSTWNDGVIPPLYLSFVPQHTYKFALAASFGKTVLSETEVAETKQYIEQYRHISVREKTAVRILKDQYGYQNCVDLVDPTLSYGPAFWRALASKRQIKEDYLLVYNLNRSREFDRYARLLAKKTGLKLVRLCTRYDQFYRPGKSVLVPSVHDFISLIDHASIVLTDSFHATAFSLNMNTAPVCVLPKQFSGRLSEFLERVDCLDRIAASYEDLVVISRTVDFERVNRILDIERERIRNFVSNVLSEIESLQT